VDGRESVVGGRSVVDAVGGGDAVGAVGAASVVDGWEAMAWLEKPVPAIYT
jgi:hypothetical protein